MIPLERQNPKAPQAFVARLCQPQKLSERKGNPDKVKLAEQYITWPEVAVDAEGGNLDVLVLRLRSAVPIYDT
jgi:hypothetical protein